MDGRLTVLQVAYPFAAVRPETAGGAEQVLAALDRALAAAGHRSLVVAAEGSRVAGELVPTPARRGEIDAAAREAAWAEHREALASALAVSPAPDVVHYHGFDFHAYLHAGGPPAVVTLHLPPAWYAATAWAAAPAVRLCCVSRSQARALPPAVAGRATLIGNGVDLDRFRPAGRRGRFALWLGRVCPEKAPHRAIAAARRAGVPLLLAGEVHPYREHRAYFARAVAPALGRGVVWLGAVGGEAKACLLARARCLVLAGEAPETSSLAALEALACGTPVVATPVGALPEIVEDGRTGFLAESESALAAAIARSGAIDPAACRRAAEERWDERRMIDEYLEVYREAIGATLRRRDRDEREVAAGGVDIARPRRTARQKGERGRGGASSVGTVAGAPGEAEQPTPTGGGSGARSRRTARQEGERGRGGSRARAAEVAGAPLGTARSARREGERGRGSARDGVGAAAGAPLGARSNAVGGGGDARPGRAARPAGGGGEALIGGAATDVGSTGRPTGSPRRSDGGPAAPPVEAETLLATQLAGVSSVSSPKIDAGEPAPGRASRSEACR